VPHHKRKAEPLTPAELERVRRLYMETDVPNTEIGRRYGKRPNWVNALAEKHGWPTRKSRAPKSAEKTPLAGALDGRRIRSPRAHKPKTIKQVILEAKAADAKRERELYGDRAADVTFLRQRNFVVTRQGTGFLVGNRECTAAELHATAQRERRLAGVAA
jgi:hypothetical protein